MGQTLKYRYEITYPHIFNVRYNRMWDNGTKNNRLREIEEWCAENISDHYKIDFDTDHQRSEYMAASFMFHNEADAIKFKLVWCGDGNDIF